MSTVSLVVVLQALGQVGGLLEQDVGLPAVVSVAVSEVGLVPVLFVDLLEPDLLWGWDWATDER